MNLKVNNELKDILKEIKDLNKNLFEWRAIESSDMFQTQNFCGGFDATEDEFTFSYFTKNNEYWFQISLLKLDKILKNEMKFIKLIKKS